LCICSYALVQNIIIISIHNDFGIILRYTTIISIFRNINTYCTSLYINDIRVFCKFPVWSLLWTTTMVHDISHQNDHMMSSCKFFLLHNYSHDSWYVITVICRCIEPIFSLVHWQMLSYGLFWLILFSLFQLCICR